MKQLLPIFVFIISSAIAQTSFQITELRGFEDQLGRTHLFYRAGGNSNLFNPVYHFDVDSNKINYFIDAFYWNYPPQLGGINLLRC